MASFLSINNLDVPVMSCTKRTVEVGAGRRYAGTWREQRRAIKREWDIETTLLAEDDAEALSHWLLGRGHHWSFDTNAFSDDGRGPVAGYTSSLAIVTGTTKFSEPLTSFMFVGSGGQYVEFSVTRSGPDLSFTISRWVYNFFDLTSWAHHVYRYDAVAGTTTITVNGSTVALHSNVTISLSGNDVVYRQKARRNDDLANTSVWIEDLVMVPYAMTDAMLSAIYTSGATQPFGRCPRVRITGTILDEAGPVEAVATLSGQSRVQAGGTSGTWSQGLRTLKFTLREV